MERTFNGPALVGSMNLFAVRLMTKSSDDFGLNGFKSDQQQTVLGEYNFFWYLSKPSEVTDTTSTSTSTLQVE